MIEQLRTLLNTDPPGYEAQNLLALGDRIPPSPEELADLNARHAGVMVLLFQDQSTWHTVLIKRPSYPGVHSDQIAFPGGKHEKADLNLQETAIRETREEVGLLPERIDHLGALSQLYIPPSNFLVHPFVGVIDGPRNWIPEVGEVAEVIEMPLSVIMGAQNVGYHPVTTRYGNMKVPAYQYDGHVIWGATGMMLAELSVALERSGFKE
ncbi:CoA pyrophosphatase [Cryomorphaceae bacterium]|nr:CoA pyrophosphatase [Cryomorphaceae bacterium]